VGGGEEKAKAEADAIAKIDAKMGYSARAAIYVKEKNWDLAKKEHLKAIAEYPQDADVHKDLAAFLLDREDYRGALEHIRKALALNGQSKQAKLIEAAANIQLAADLDNAARTLTELASNRLNDADPSFDEVYYWLGECHAAKGDKSKAIEAFTSALSFNPWHEKAKKRISKLK
jgi:Tfp pilus assembly protein PilF